MVSLEEVQAKFDIIQKFSEVGLAGLLSTISKFCLTMSFGEWYSDSYHGIDEYNKLLKEENFPIITTEDLMVFYEYMQKKRKASPAGLEPTTP